MSVNETALQRVKRTEYSMASIDRLVAVLNAFDGESAVLGLADVSKLSGLDKSTTFRYLGALESKGFIEREPDSGRYQLGMRLFLLGQMALRTRDIRREALVLMRDLVERFGETVNLGIFEHEEVILIEVLESPQSIRKGATVGGRDPLHSTALGKAILAALPRADALDLLRRATMRKFTPRTIISVTKMARELDMVATRGFALDDEETESGLRCAGISILDREGRPRYALSISGPSSRLSRKDLRRIGSVLTNQGPELCRRIGFLAPEVGQPTRPFIRDSRRTTVAS